MTFEPVIPSFLLIPLGALLVLSPLIGYGVLRGARPPARRLAALRSALAALLVFALWGPTRVVSESKAQKTHLAFLVDNSFSMSIRDAGGASRAGALERALAAIKPRLARLDEVIVHPLAFGERIAAAEGWRHDATDRATALGGALVEARAAVRHGAALVVATDGVSNLGPDPVEVASSLAAEGIRLYCLGVGSAGSVRRAADALVRNLGAPATVSARSRFDARADVELIGCRGRPVRIEFLLGGVRVARRTVRPRTDRDLRRVRVAVEAPARGTFELTARILPLPGELSADNNAMSTQVRVVDNRIRVLHLEGSLRWEATFLRRALEASPVFEVETMVGQGQLAFEPLADPEALRKYDVVMIGDLPAADLPPRSCSSSQTGSARQARGS